MNKLLLGYGVLRVLYPRGHPQKQKKIPTPTINNPPGTSSADTITWQYLHTVSSLRHDQPCALLRRLGRNNSFSLVTQGPGQKMKATVNSGQMHP